jgi:hypothetical protein
MKNLPTSPCLALEFFPITSFELSSKKDVDTPIVAPPIHIHVFLGSTNVPYVEVKNTLNAKYECKSFVI